MAHMVSQCKGTYNLQGEKGQYVFKKDGGGACSGRLEADGRPCGTFVWEPILKGGGALRIGDGARELRCVSVCDTEIMEEIQSPSSRGAFFVLPSQLNGAEYPSCDNRAIVSQIDEYKFDNTGGPRGQLAVHPAAGQFVIDNAANDRRPGGLNAVDAILKEKEGSFRLQNGYLELPGGSGEAALDAFRRNLASLRILAMLDVQACGLKPNKCARSDAEHTVSLVYASAVPVDAYTNSIDARSSEGRMAALAFQAAVAEDELVAQYYGAMRLAAESRDGPTKIYLMPLGGGVFNNPWDVIGRAMSKAVEMLSEDQLGRLDIRALAWKGRPEEAETLRRLLAEHGKLKE